MGLRKKHRPKILVTGSCGYIGSHCARLLSQRGYEVVGLDNLSHGYEDSFRGRLWKEDLRDEKRLYEVLKAERPQVVMHFAALVSVEEGERDPWLYVQNNTWGTYYLVQAMLRAKVPCLIFSSTAAVYGEPQQVPISEDHPRKPANTYGFSKKLSEDMLEEHAKQDGLRFAALRYFNVAGREFGLPKNFPTQQETHLLPRVLEVAAGRAGALDVYGQDYDTRDGTCVRDYIHVTDICGAHILLLERLLNGDTGGFFNVGTGDGFTVKEVVEASRRVTGQAIPARFRSRRPGDVAALVASNQKLKTLGWQLKYSSLESLIANMWQWWPRADGRGLLSAANDSRPGSVTLSELRRPKGGERRAATKSRVKTPAAV